MQFSYDKLGERIKKREVYSLFIFCEFTLESFDQNSDGRMFFLTSRILNWSSFAGETVWDWI